VTTTSSFYKSSGLTDLVRPNHIHRGYYTTRASANVRSDGGYDKTSIPSVQLQAPTHFIIVVLVTDPSVVFLVFASSQQHQVRRLR
jgi:hypothetical protein